MPTLNLVYSGPSAAADTGAENKCLKAEVEKVGFSESSCGNGNSDLYKALLARISGQSFPVNNFSGNFSAAVWVQDKVGNGYNTQIVRGTLQKESLVSTQSVGLFTIIPDKIVNGYYDFEEETGWIVDKIIFASWVGSVTNAAGSSVAKPVLVIEEGKIKVISEVGVIGSLKIKYQLTRDKFSVVNDGGGETTGDPYSTALVFDVDGCPDKETVLPLSAAGCLAEKVANSLGVDGLLELLSGDNVGDVSHSGPEKTPTEKPQNTERKWDYCTREFKSASPASAGEGYEGTCFGIVCGACGDDEG